MERNINDKHTKIYLLLNLVYFFLSRFPHSRCDENVFPLISFALAQRGRHKSQKLSEIDAFWLITINFSGSITRLI
jgi:hypothetical protein